jgi:peroxiredoxin
MSKIQTNIPAPDFTLADFRGQPVSLSDFRGEKNVLVVFNRGFA